MTKKHYKALAGIIRQAKRDCREPLLDKTDTVNRLQESIANFLIEDNGRFNRSSFMEACNIKFTEKSYL